MAAILGYVEIFIVLLKFQCDRYNVIATASNFN